MKSTIFEKYINNVCNIILEDSLFRDQIKSSTIFEISRKEAKDAKSFDDCNLIVQSLIKELRKSGDLHSKFKIFNPENVKGYEDEDINRSPEVRILDGCGYIKLYSFDGTDEKEIVEFSQNLQDEIQEISKQDLKGYIIDLRDNPGGNMDPMILGLGSLIEKNPCAYFSFPNGVMHSWGYKDGSYYYNNEIIFTLTNPFIIQKRLPVAVLINERTASSAEMLTISLQNKDVKLFGCKTKNRTTGNSIYKFEDKSKLVLSTCKLVSLEGKDYLGGIIPDFKVTDTKVLDSAISWIKK